MISPEETGQSAFPVVGIGASAGGLEAFAQLLNHLRSDTGMAFVFVQHLDPTHRSALAELLARETVMPVVEATDGLVLAPDSVYVIAADKDVTLEGGALRLAARPSSGPHLPIDLFLGSLAQDRESGAVAVILSGTAADGSQGVKKVKAAGGTTLAQDPATARYPGMPNNAIATGDVDFVLPTPLLAEQLAVISGRPGGTRTTEDGAPRCASSEDPLLGDLLALIRATTSADFSNYKQGTILRRINRRMAVRHVGSLEEYVGLLRKDPGEVEALYQDLLIRMTSFFRQPHVFEALKEKIFPQIAGAKADDQVRFWVPGCSTGEEAYSLAIAWAEFLGGKRLAKSSVQVFASDINQQVIDKARTGVYPSSITSDVSPDRLARFFIKVDAGYQVAKDIRESCVFAKHDLTRDPPFSKLDLISLRNVLIYLGPLLQRRIMPILHFGLRPGGFLLLGESESIGGFTDLFSLVDKRAKIYVSKEGAPATVPGAPARPISQCKPAPPQSMASTEFDLVREADRIVLDRYAPTGVIVDADLKVQQFRGRPGGYLELGPGRATLDLGRLAREGLAGELSNALREAKKGQVPLRRENIRIIRDERVVAVGFDVIPIKSPTGEASFLVLFHDMPGGEDGLGGELVHPAETSEDGPARIAALERELRELREYARAVLEDKESANEELRSANEELQSTNEELQSVNEELATTSEEIESTNEELQTLNEELGSVNDQLTRLNEELRDKNVDIEDARDYARTVVDTVREPLVVLGDDGRVVSANLAYYRVFDARAAETIGRTFFELEDGQWDVPQLREALERVDGEEGSFQDLVVDRDFARVGRRTVLLSGRRIRAADSGPARFLLAIDDITERALAEGQADRLHEQRRRDWSLDEALIGLAASSATELNEGFVLEGVLGQAMEALEADSARYLEPGPEGWHTRYMAGNIPDSRQSDPMGFDPCLIEQLDRDRVPFLVTKEELDGGSLSGLILVPLVVGTELVGVLKFGYDEPPEFGEADQQFSRRLSSIVSLALHNARLYESQRSIAERMQGVLSEDPQGTDQVKFAHLYRSATREAHIGGDFYDVFQAKDQRVAVLIGDVSGHGLEAARTSTLVKDVIHAFAHQFRDPSLVLRKTNQFLIERGTAGFVTVHLGILDAGTGLLRYSSAGHPPMLLRRASGEVQALGSGSFPLGVYPDSSWKTAEVRLEADDILLLHTDGVTEARRDDEFFGEDRLERILKRKRISVERLPQLVLNTVLDFSGGTLLDDLAMLALSLAESPAQTETTKPFAQEKLLD